MSVQLWFPSVVCLAIVGLLCTVAVLSDLYHDTFWQRVFLAVLCVGCLGRAHSIWQMEISSFDWFIVHFGMAGYAVATAVKCISAHYREKRVYTEGNVQHLYRRRTDRQPFIQ